MEKLHEVKELLGKLKEYAIALKLDLASEFVSEEEAFKFISLSDAVGIKTEIKVGGCDAFTDISLAKKLNAKILLAPMIETKYALEKFINHCRNIYNPNDIQKIQLYANVETITAYKDIDNILSANNIEYLTGIILGRDDLLASMGLHREQINSDRIIEIGNNISALTLKNNKKFIVGGEIRPAAIHFLKSIDNLYAFETRKIVFNSSLLFCQDAENIISDAIKFEILWLNYKAELNGFMSETDKNRISILSSYIIE